MPKKILQPGAELNIPTPGLWLSILAATGIFQVSSDEFSPLEGKTGKKFHLEDITQVTLFNPNVDSIEVEYESANIRVESAGGGSVSVDNKVVVQRIEDPIVVNAQATVDNGTMTSQSHSSLTELPDVNIAANAKALVIPAAGNGVEKRTVIIQNISAAEQLLRVGGSTVAVNRGAKLLNKDGLIASVEFECLGEVHVYNDSGSQATVSVMWGQR